MEKDVLAYIDEHFCTRLEGPAKDNCKSMIEISNEELIEQIEQGTVSIDKEFRCVELIVLGYLATIVDLHVFPNVFHRSH